MYVKLPALPTFTAANDVFKKTTGFGWMVGETEGGCYIHQNNTEMKPHHT